VLQFELSTGITGINIFIKKYSCINYHFLYIVACNQRCPFFLVLFGFTSRLLLQVFIGSRLVQVPIGGIFRLCIFWVFPRVGSKLSYWVKIAITGGFLWGFFLGFFTYFLLTILYIIVNSYSQNMATVLQFAQSDGITGIKIFIKKKIGTNC
jgi:hypothetical protein